MEPPVSWRVRIRMHRQGVGDCFLLTFRMGDRPVHMLIDCGVLPASPAEHNHLSKVAAAVRDEVKANGGKLDVIVITHEHADHVSGFEPGTAPAKALGEIAVDEVWMAWTEDPADPLAQRLNGQLAMHAMAAATALAPLKSAGAKRRGERFAARAQRTAEEIGDILDNLGISDQPYAGTAGTAGAALPAGFAFGAAAMGAMGPMGARLAKTVRAAMDHVKSRVPAEKFRKFHPGEIHFLPGVPEDQVRIFVLGPPRLEDLDKRPRHGASDDIFHLRSDDLRAQARSLAAAVAARTGVAKDDETARPFDESLGCEPASKALKELRSRYEKDEWRGIEDDWLMVAGEFAMQLDHGINNTSLALAIEFVETGEVLLFPGDAQIENWETWRNVTWTVPAGGDRPVEITGEDLIKRAVFYKVSHHGSHNGTLDAHGVQLMRSSGLVAMCPVVHEVTKKRKGDWKEIPKPSLCAALKDRCGDGFLRMDDPKGTLAGRLGGRVQESDLWIDYYLV